MQINIKFQSIRTICFCSSVATKFVSLTDRQTKKSCNRVQDIPKCVNLLKTGRRKFLRIQCFLLVYVQESKKAFYSATCRLTCIKIEKNILFTFFYIYIKRKYWIRENFRLPVFDGFTCFEMSWTRFDHFWKTFVYWSLSVYASKILWTLYLKNLCAETDETLY